LCLEVGEELVSTKPASPTQAVVLLIGPEVERIPTDKVDPRLGLGLGEVPLCQLVSLVGHQAGIPWTFDLDDDREETRDRTLDGIVAHGRLD
jgi:hypothetical protein